MGNKISRRRPIIDESLTKPQGLYEHKDVDAKKLRRLILDAKLAPCYPGSEDQLTDLDECPICFLFYPSLNRSKCCLKSICTECFLQIKAPLSARPTQCPFCKMHNYAVEYRGAKTREEKKQEQAEEQRVIEAQIKLQQRELNEQKKLEVRNDDGRHKRVAPQAQIGSVISGKCSPSAVNGALPVGEIVLSHGDRFENWMYSANSTDDFRTMYEDASSYGTYQVSSSLSSENQGMHWENNERLQRDSIPGSSNIERSWDGLNIDLEEMMVMEAIRLSIQDQDLQGQSSMPASPILLDSDLGMEFGFEHGPEDNRPHVPVNNNSINMTGRTSFTGGLAGALKAFVEHRILNVVDASRDQLQSNNRFIPAYSVNNCKKEGNRTLSETHLVQELTAQVQAEYAYPQGAATG